MILIKKSAVLEQFAEAGKLAVQFQIL